MGEAAARQRAIVVIVAFIAIVALAMPLSSARADEADPLAQVGLDQHPGAAIPLDLTFRDEAGREVRLADFVGSRPTILTLNYYRCPTLCSLVLGSLARGLRDVALAPGEQFAIVTVSIDPGDTPTIAAAKKAELVAQYGRDGAAAGWHFLTGDDAQIRRLAAAIGFRYTYDARQGQYIHPAAIALLTPAGQIARYLLGITYPARDLRLALVEASDGQIGSPVDQVLLLCYHYDTATGRYAAAIDTFIKGASLAVAGALALLIGRQLLRERRARARG